MNFETLFQLDPNVWPFAVMLFMRIVTVLFFLPIFGDPNIPTRLRILLALMLSLCIWPTVEKHLTTSSGFIQWSPIALALATLREVFFGFTIGFAAKMLTFAASIAANTVGINMGFQTATLFSPQSGTQESAFTTLKVWLVTILILTFNIHHVFIQNIVGSFLTIPFASQADPQALMNVIMQTITVSFDIGMRIAGPLLLIQTLATIALGLLNRALPQLNAFVISFPVSFLVSMVVLFFGASAFVRLMGEHAGIQEVSLFSKVQKAFSPVR